MSEQFTSERLGTLNRMPFSCGDGQLDAYFHQQASQDERRRLARTFVLREVSGVAIAGFYTLSAMSLVPAMLPSEVARKLPRFDQIPGMLLSRLAVDLGFQGQGVGGRLLLDAIARIEAIEAGVFMIVVDAYESARGFYAKFGFQLLPGSGSRMILPMDTVRRALLPHQTGDRALNPGTLDKS